MAEKPRIGVIGAGLMGHGIAQVFATHGHAVTVYDPDGASLATLRERIQTNLRNLGQPESAAERVSACRTLREAVQQSEFIVEAALEDLPLKQQIFADLEQAAPAHAILASNTSVIPITAIMQGLRDRSRALGTHWWNPPYLVPLVEVIGTQWTSADAIARTIALHHAVGKTAVHVKRD